MKLFYTKTALRVLIGTLLTLLLFSAGTLAFTGCDEILDPTMGTLRLTNKSISTVQRIMIDGINYGTIDPDESKDISLAPGTHVFQQVGISGGGGCSEASVIIVAGRTSAFSCSN